MPVWVTVPEPIATYLNDTTTVFTTAFPSCFIPFDIRIYDWFNDAEVTKLLPSEIVFELAHIAAARFGSSIAKTV